MSCVSNPSGCSTYTSSSTTPFKNVVLTSIWCTFHFITTTNAKYRSDGSVSCYGCKCLLVVYAFFLGEAMHHEPYLVFFNATICSMLDLVDPLQSHDRLPLWSQNYLPYIIIHNRLVLLNHGILPLFPFL